MIDMQALSPLAVVAGALGAGLFQRWRAARRQKVEIARNVQTERLLTLLSVEQPGVWDHEDLRTRMTTFAEEVWTLPSREALETLRFWLSPTLWKQLQKAWLRRADRREARLRLQ